MPRGKVRKYDSPGKSGNQGLDNDPGRVGVPVVSQLGVKPIIRRQSGIQVKTRRLGF